MYCPKCGQENPENEVICQRCGELLSGEKTNVEQEKIEKIPNGIVGALLGALIGGVVIVLLYQLEMVSTWSGVLLAFCALKGYELLGGKMSKLGMVISVIFIAIMPLCAYFVSLGMFFVEEWKQYIPDITLLEGIQGVFELMAADSEMQGAVIADLLQLYLFTGGGVVLYFVINKIIAKKKAK